jgi:acyl-CoA-binding protein
MFDLTGKAKWNAWDKLKGSKTLILGTSKADAEARYIAKVKALIG